MIKSIKLPLVVVVLLVMTLVLVSFKSIKRKRGTVQITFTHSIEGGSLILDSAFYTNGLGQEFSVSKFRYYIGNIELNNSSGKNFKSSEYYLIDEETVLSKLINLKEIPIGAYDELSFIIGVDSIHNCNGAQSGALDPLNAMFWSWNTGYIYLKFEGNSKACSTPQNFFEYHIGGYQYPNNSARTVSIPLKPLIISKDKTAKIDLKVDLGEVLKNPNPIDFAKTPVVTGTKNAQLVADNYSRMFSLIASDHEE